MANRPLGNDEAASLKHKLLKKYDADLEKAILQWVAGVLDDTEIFNGIHGHRDVRRILKDGVILCKLMNKIKPGTIPKYNSKACTPFQMMENIGFFNQAMKEYGVTSQYMFVTTDLYEGQNMTQVLIGLRDLGVKATANGVHPPFSI